jgi:ribosomal protein L23
MTTAILLQTEKSTNVQQEGIFAVSFIDKNFKMNKVELKKLLRKVKLDAISINTTKTPAKQKRKGKQGRTVSVYRPSKYYIKLKTGQKIDDKIIESLNELLNPKPTIK